MKVFLKKLNRGTKHVAVSLGLLLLVNESVLAQDYPFSFPSTFKATLDVNTSKKEMFKNQLMGYNIEGFSTKVEKDFMRKFDPVSVRFPHGVFANFYNWRTDGYQKDSYDNGGHEASLLIFADRIKGHIDGIAELNQERKLENGFGYHMMWTYSMNFDDAASCIARAKKDVALGLELKDIELGNEHFWRNQRSNQTKTEIDFRNRAVSVANALHKEFPDVRVSIPLGWRRTQADYNTVIAGDKKYYDAISLHRYMGADPDVPGESDNAYSSLLTARLTLDDDAKWLRSNYGSKPIWLTEWGVSAGSAPENNSAACLGMADVFLLMSEKQNVYDRANWFSFNRALNPMVLVDLRTPVYPLKKRGYLMAYEIVRDVLFDGTMYQATMATESIRNSLGSMNAVNARVATKKDGKTNVVVVNLSDKPVEFILKFDGVNYTKSFKHEALAFGQLGNVPNIDVDSDPLTLIKNGTGKITLPPLSISKISNIILSVTTENKPPVVAVTSPTNNAVFELGQEIPLLATASDPDGNLEKVNFKINDAFFKTIVNAPFEFTFSPTEIGTYKIAARAFDTDNLQTEEFVTITVVQANQPPTVSVVSPLNDAIYEVGQAIPLRASATDADGNLVNVNFKVNDAFYSTHTSRPFETSFSPTKAGVYKIAARAFDQKNAQTESFVTVEVRLVTSIEDEIAANSLVIYPNPSAVGIFNLSQDTDYEVVSLTGVTLLKGTGNRVDLTSFQRGTYLLKTDSKSMYKLVY